MATPLVIQLLSKAIWAPSAANFQPWKFVIHNESSFSILFCKDERSMYDMCGHKTFTDIGCLVETISIIAANDFSHHAIFSSIQSTVNTDSYSIQVDLKPSNEHASDVLSDYIHSRSTNRLPYLQTPLTETQKSTLEKELSHFQSRIVWIERQVDKEKMSKLWRVASKVRFLLPNGIEFFKNMMEWNDTSSIGGSIDKIPIHSSGVSSAGRKILKVLVEHPKLMRNIMSNNLDFIMNKDANVKPCVNCAAHFGVYIEQNDTNEMESMEDMIRVGRGFMRFWLRATTLGLHVHPESIIPIIACLLRANLLEIPDDCKKHCDLLVELCKEIFGERVLIVGRIGFGESDKLRSLRKPLDSFIVEDNTK